MDVKEGKGSFGLKEEDEETMEEGMIYEGKERGEDL